MSVSPKYRTNFSVTDILSPLEETSLRLKPYDSPNSAENQLNSDSSYLLLNSIISGTEASGIGTNNNHHQQQNKSTGMSVPVSTPFGMHQLGMHPSAPTPHSGGTPGGSSGSAATSSSAFSSAAAAAAAAGSQYSINGSATELSTAYGVSAGDVRAHPPAPWYTSSTSDPRFASDYTLSTGKRENSIIYLELIIIMSI